MPTQTPTSTPRIAMLGPSYPFRGGIAQYTTRLFRELSVNYAIEFISFRRQYPTWLYPGGSDTDDSDTALKEPRAKPLLDSLNPLTWVHTARTIIAYQADILLIPWWVVFWVPQYLTIMFLVRRKLPELKVVFLCHNVIGHEKNAVARFLSRFTLRKGDAFLVQSVHERDELTSWLPGSRVEIAEHPAYGGEQQQLPGRSEARAGLGLSGKVLLFFGFVRPYKGLDVLLRAMPEILREQPCTLLVAGEIWGDKSRYNKLLDTPELQSRVQLLDSYIPQEQVARYFCAADLVMLPYRSVTGSGVVKLAYSFGRPVVVSNVGAMSDIVNQGKTGYLVPPDDPQALAQCVNKHFAVNRQQQMDAAALEHGQQYTWLPVISALQRLFSVASNAD